MTKPVYIFRNKDTNKALAYSNAKLAFKIYEAINKADDSDFFAYSTFRMKLKKQAIAFSHYVIERTLLVQNQTEDYSRDIDLLCS